MNSLTPKFRFELKIEHKTGTIRNPRQKLQLIYDPLCFENPLICSNYRKNPHPCDSVVISKRQSTSLIVN